MTLTREEKEDHVVFGVSFLIHVVAILCLASYFVKDDTKEAAVVILSTPVEEPALEQQASIQDISTFSETETRLVPDESSQPDPVVVDNDTPQQKVTLDDLTFSTPQVDFLAESDSLARDHSEVASDAQGEGAANEGVASVAGAVDRLTAEIVGSAAQKETLVVWLFDASLSLNAQRQQIAGRLEKILAEIKGEEDIYPVRHVVCGFGEKLDMLIKEPTDDTDKIVTQIRDVTLDESGVENIFTCITRLASDYKSTKNKRAMIIAFTDEVGDDQAQADHTAVVAGQNAVAVYVVGTPAPFGIATTQLKFVDPDEQFDQSERWVEIDQGPESLFKMTLNISSLPIDSEAMDSGFGPYALCRLCASTGGIYFALHPNRRIGTRVQPRSIQPMSSNIQHFFDSKVMKQYPPDYRRQDLQRKEAASHAAKKALVTACSLPRIDCHREVKTIFDAPNQGQFVSELAEGQKTAVSLQRRMDDLHSVLQQGEKAAASLKEPRWRASFFLAMGRILAIKTRLDAYNAVLGDAKAGTKAKKKDTNRWILEPDDNPDLLNSLLKKQSESAKKYLETVVEEFPHTPWALMAEEELKVPLAYKWVESHYEPLVRKENGTASNTVSVPQDDKKKELPRLKPQRKFDKI
jgi:hypothetical protein